MYFGAARYLLPCCRFVVVQHATNLRPYVFIRTETYFNRAARSHSDLQLHTYGFVHTIRRVPIQERVK